MAQKKDKLQELLNKRSQNPLAREAVEPVNFYASKDVPLINVAQRMQEVAYEQTNRIAESLANKEEPRPLSETRVDQRPINTTNEQMLKFASYIPVETHRALKFLAIQEDKKMYEIIRDAIEYYMQKKLSGK
ncbi:MAG: hypothetical protein Q8Q65_03985 [bacterium]|nr:hypothetical protein [bacterium]